MQLSLCNVYRCFTSIAFGFLRCFTLFICPVAEISEETNQKYFRWKSAEMSLCVMYLTSAVAESYRQGEQLCLWCCVYCSLCVPVCLCPRLKGKQLELSTSKFHWYRCSPLQSLTVVGKWSQKVKGQRSKTRDHSQETGQMWLVLLLHVDMTALVSSF